MLHRLLSALTFANVCSFLALTIALGTGAAYAANTVRSRDIANGQVKAPDIGRNAVTSPKTKTGAVTLTDLAPGAVDRTKVRSDSLTAGNLAADSVHIKVCNLSGATSAAITDLPVRIITFH